MLENFYSIVDYFLGRYYSVKQDTPITITVTSTAQPLVNASEKLVVSYLIRIRDMATATYLEIGDQYAQKYRLTMEGESFGFNANPNEVFDVSKVYVKSDASMTIEYYALYKENLYASGA